MLDERLVKLRAVLRLDVLADCAAILNEQNCILLLLCALCLGSGEYLEQISQEVWCAVQVIHYVDLIEENQAV